MDGNIFSPGANFAKGHIFVLNGSILLNDFEAIGF